MIVSGSGLNHYRCGCILMHKDWVFDSSGCQMPSLLCHWWSIKEEKNSCSPTIITLSIVASGDLRFWPWVRRRERCLRRRFHRLETLMRLWVTLSATAISHHCWRLQLSQVFNLKWKKMMNYWNFSQWKDISCFRLRVSNQNNITFS